eukprot:TRINITY_DN4835_c0_g1_i2.p1 TRINITY_DN4835_c0_g1~~TRINITY_DN4835_c0_g1_i2.p1  ORF type:complete len:536 (+),score=122.30 TRINITY_DN4835_c0_g1_i2:51-1658(+)
MQLQLPSSWKVIAFTCFLLCGLTLSQVLGIVMEAGVFQVWTEVMTSLTMWALSFIMIGVGYEFTFLVARFAAPTSAGILFSMLEAAGLRETWVFQKARVLAIFDDLDTILLMIPLKVLMIGFKWELCVVIAIMAILLAVAWFKLHALRLPHTWYWTLFYAAIIAAVCKVTHYVTHHYIDMEPIHIEVLLPAFVMGCIVDTPCAREELKMQRKNSAIAKELKKLKTLRLSSSSHLSEASSRGDNEASLQNSSDLKQAANAEADASTTKGTVVQPTVEGDAFPPGTVVEAWQSDEKKQDSATAALQYGRRPGRNSRRNTSKESTGSSASSASSRLSRHGLPQPAPETHEDLHEEDKWEHIACTVVSMVFMVLVGLSMPPLIGEPKTGGDGHRRLAGSQSGVTKEEADVQEMAPELIVAHVIAVSALMVIGKMFPAVCYREEATFKERFALCLGMCPRGEVGASIIVISLELGVQGPSVIISMCSLVINLVLSGGFIGMVKCLIRGSAKQSADDALTQTKVQDIAQAGQEFTRSTTCD